jgi:hypothetical protein
MPMTEKFLELEYQQSLDLVKHYDTRQLELLKVASALTAVVPTVVLAFYDLGTPVRDYVWDFAGVIALATVLSLLPIYAALVQTRLYFVFPARQLNAIRKRMVGDFKADNCMYLGGDYPPAFRLGSTQTILYVFVALQTAFFAAIAVFALGRHFMPSVAALIMAVLLAVGLGYGMFGAAKSHLITGGVHAPGAEPPSQAQSS